MKKRTLKKSKKAVKIVRKVKKGKKAAKSKPKKKAVVKKSRGPKPIGVVTHFYTHISVVIVKFNKKVSVGAKLHYKGATTDFAEVAKSMQYNHEAVKVAPKGKQIGIKVKKRVRKDDRVYVAE